MARPLLQTSNDQTGLARCMNILLMVTKLQLVPACTIKQNCKLKFVEKINGQHAVLQKFYKTLHTATQYSYCNQERIQTYGKGGGSK